MNNKRFIKRILIVLTIFIVISGAVLLIKRLGLRIPYQTQSTETKLFSVNLPQLQLPSLHEIMPDIYDEQGCRILPKDEGGGKICPAPPDSSAKSTENDPNPLLNLQGFIGRFYAATVSGKEIRVLQETLRVTQNGKKWQASGLVRNETTNNISVASITAMLIDQNGKVITQCSDKALVENIRPGEPVPFMIRCDIPDILVARTEWSVMATTSSSKTISRAIMIDNYYEIPFGATGYHNTFFDKPSDAFVISSGFQNLGDPFNNAKLVVAWVDKSHRVIWTESVSQTDTTTDSIQKGMASNFEMIEVSDKELKSKMSDGVGEIYYWAMGW